MDKHQENDLVISNKYAPLFAWLSAKPGTPLYDVDTAVETGGRYSQKSFATGVFSCVAAKDYNHRILYTRYTLTSAEDSIIPEFTEKIDLLNCHPSFEVKKDRISGVHNDSKIVFRGIKTSTGNQTASLKSLKNFSMFILEEAEEMTSYENWDKIKKSIRALDVRNLNILILNPTTKENWIYQELFEARGVPEGFNGVVGNVLYIHTSYLDLERHLIPDSIYYDFEDKREAYKYYQSLSKEQQATCDKYVKRKAEYYRHVVLGGWLEKAEGVIFDNWSIGTYQEPSPPVYGQDFGFSIDPTTLVKTSIDKKNKKIYIKLLLYRPRLTTSQIAEENLKHAGQGIIYADSAEPRLIEELLRYNCNIKAATKGQGSVTAGIALLQDYELIIDTTDAELSRHLINELNNYVWHDKKSGVPVDRNNHILDAIRYACTPQLEVPESYGLSGGKVNAPAPVPVIRNDVKYKNGKRVVT